MARLAMEGMRYGPRKPKSNSTPTDRMTEEQLDAGQAFLGVADGESSSSSLSRHSASKGKVSRGRNDKPSGRKRRQGDDVDEEDREYDPDLDA